MLVVSLRDVNEVFSSHLGCSGRNTIKRLFACVRKIIKKNAVISGLVGMV